MYENESPKERKEHIQRLLDRHNRVYDNLLKEIPDDKQDLLDLLLDLERELCRYEECHL